VTGSNSWVSSEVSIWCKVFIMLGLGLDFVGKAFCFSSLLCKVLPIKGLDEEKCPGLWPGAFASTYISSISN
jgi:hypothetical protein